MIFIVGLSIMLCIYFTSILYKKISILKGVSLGITAYFFFYVMGSAILFWCSVYSIFRAIVLTFLISVVICLIIWKKMKTVPKVYSVNKEWWIFAFVLCIVMPFSLNKFEYFGMGQDEGVYQTKAIELMNDNTERIFTFEEYDLLETEEAKDSYYNNLVSLLGYDVLNEFDYKESFNIENMTGAYDDTAGIYHGIPTFPAILALFGELFGISQMQDCQSVFLALLLLLTYYILDNYKIEFPIQCVILLALGLSPEVIWVSKSALTEMFLALIIAAYILLMTENKTEIKLLSCMPILIFSFYHITIYTMMPFFMLIYWGEYIIQKDKKYLTAGWISIIAYFMGYLFMLYISPRYVFWNYIQPLSRFLPVTAGTLQYIILGGCIAALVITCALRYPVGIIQNAIDYCRSKVNWNLVYKVCLAIFLIAFFVISARKILQGSSPTDMTLVAYSLLAGFLLLPMILVKLFRENISERCGFVLPLMFLYSIVIYSVSLRTTTSFYYYTRYLMPYLLIICVFWGVLYSNIKNWLLLLVGGICIGSYLRADILLMNGTDDSNLEWNVLEDLMEIEPEENSAWIISDSLNSTCFMLLNSKGYDVYNEWRDLNEERAYLFEKYSCVYYVTKEVIFDNENEFEIVYRNDNKASEDSGQGRQTFLNYPLEFDKTYSTITVYKTYNEKLLYEISSSNFVGSGFNVLEGHWSWTSDEAYILCWLRKKDYQATITQGCPIPFDELGFEEFEVQVYVNGEYVTTMVIDDENNGKNLCFDLPQKYISEGENIVSLKCDTWSPYEYGSADNRQLGIAFQSLKFSFENK